ncbi:ABC transporter permease [Petroclostridium sp. X23]|uniref:ABC transporter permease n=1 Tax=Petroclostridium sp. X23 TaxID=3045146 RepID=UPI0024AD68A3|nr:ABC transporter permease [Petroclostridium sp. X23]WHH59040.1 ABC transporter permease [Petroclostridium sp. X23]
MKQTAKNILKWPPFPAFLLLMAFIVLNAIITPGFLDLGFFTGFLSSNVPLVCVAIGVSVVLIGGGIDISLGAVVSLINVIFVTLIGLGWNLGAAIMLCLVISIILGAINGFIVGFLRVTPLLATFATSSIFGGLALWIMPTPGGAVPMDYVTWYNDTWLGIPISILFILVSFLLWLFLKYSPVRLWLYSIGRDENKAYVSAVPVTWIQFFIYTFAAFASGIGAIALTGSVGAGDPLIGLSFSMSSIAACVIGGITLSGGIGETTGAVFGSLFLGLVITTVLSVSVDPFYQEFVQGLILLVGVLGATIVGRKTLNIQ